MLLNTVCLSNSLVVVKQSLICVMSKGRGYNIYRKLCHNPKVQLDLLSSEFPTCAPTGHFRLAPIYPYQIISKKTFIGLSLLASVTRLYFLIECF